MTKLPIFIEKQQDKKTQGRKFKHIGITLFLIVLINNIVRFYPRIISLFDGPHNPDSLCPLAPKIDPGANTDTIDKILNNLTFRNGSISKWAGSVKIPTVLYDDTITPDSIESTEELYKLEPLWENFEKLHTYLEETFPLVHHHLKVEKVNKFGLVYTWKGTSDKKPILLAAHQDVVPVEPETVNQWLVPPFSGIEKDGFLYGRGVSDCKNLLIGLLEAIELLLEEDRFKPERTVLLGFGYDEESKGLGAKAIGQFLLERYGPDSIYMIIDEGEEGYIEFEGTKFIPAATGEKGCFDSVIELFTPGGHSSIPPKHTSIGIMGKLADKIESKEFDSILTNSNPVLSQLQCYAQYSGLDKSLKSDILKAHLDVNANKRILDYLNKEAATKYLVTTSQAIDVIKGGVKSNALPEHVSMLVNHRVAIEETVRSTADKVTKDVKSIADQFDLGLIVDGKTLIEPTKNGYFNYSIVQPLEPAPVTPMNTKPWNLLAGSLRYLYEDILSPESDDIYYFTPGMSSGNTDTKSYWDLSTNIFRYAPGGLQRGLGNIHSVNENYPIDDHLSIIAFYYYFIPIVDKADDGADE